MSDIADYYTTQHKVIRDVVHGYIHMSAFEISLVDTPHFQRLRDIRQVMAAYVFPNANHSRFEHSLGTFELTRKALIAVSANNVFLFKTDNAENRLNPVLTLSTRIAALLHDIGHSPFSHLGESQFKEDDITRRLKAAFSRVEIPEHLSENGAVHEKLSCLVIIERMWEEAGFRKAGLDLQHICRCILGVCYVDYTELPMYMKERGTALEALAMANFCIRLVNWEAFDMDSLDYIMRDNVYCDVSGTKIDIARLFANMSVSREGYPIFRRQAITVLKDIIDGKNSYYLFALYHHALVYANFIYAFIFRRLRNDGLEDMDKYFTADAVIYGLVSDSDVFAMMKNKFREYKRLIDTGSFSGTYAEANICLVHDLLSGVFSRNFLKPFWKDIIEFEAFKARHFPGKEDLFNQICERVCGSDSELFRSEAVPAIVRAVNALHGRNPQTMPGTLKNHELFLVARRQKWLEKANIDKLSVYIRENEVRHPANFGEEPPFAFVERPLHEVLPLSPYSDYYSKHCFYIYIKPISTPETNARRVFYTNIERIIVLVLTYFSCDTSGRVNELFSACAEKKPALIAQIDRDINNQLEGVW